MEINKIIEQLELVSLENGYQQNILLWEQYFKGFVDGIHEYQEYNGRENVVRKRQSLGMAKKGCEDWADVLYNPETFITVEESFQDRFDEIIDMSDFVSKVNDNIEKGMALGTMAIITTKINDKPVIDFATADMLYPVTDGTTQGWAVISEYETGVYYVSVHYTELKDKYRVDNFIVKSKDGDVLEVLSKEALQSEYGIKDTILYPTPMLHLFKPAIANNIDYTTPYGISIYANALSELNSVDIAYSSMLSDIVTGKRLTFTTVDNMKNVDGSMKFSNAEGFYIMEGDKTFSDGATLMFKEPTLKDTSIINYIEVNLNLLGRKLGFGDNAYNFKEGSIYTNTSQVISTQSKFNKTRNKMLVPLREALESMVEAIYYLEKGSEYDGDITVEFDDSILHDKEREDKELDFQLMNGLISEVYYWEVKKSLTTELATQFVQEQRKLKGLVELPEEEGGEE